VKRSGLKTRLLSAAEFQKTFGPEMTEITGRENEVSPSGVLDIKPYFQAIPGRDLRPHSVPECIAEYVYRSSDSRYDHVLFPTATENVYLVLVVDLAADKVLGHHILDLAELYGLNEESQA